ncbi:THAP-type domain-containing protein [Aphis craccivora]|uniref:THAP-type domain-containing protein n=1 Tax=Aphis craccivora TaxID=307492 RepID=A0A6G0YAQ6_APHCR|nr:THAP-type domain-containing protein [Aphis craccivora]
MDNIKILTVSSNRKKSNNDGSLHLDVLCAEVNEEDLISSSIYTRMENLINVDNDIIEYIAGFIVHKLEKNILCNVCLGALTRSHSEPNSLLSIKNRGGLTKPSVDIILLCKVANRVFKAYKNKLISEKNILSFLILKSTSQINIKTFFLNITDHFFDQDAFNNHLLQLIHLILKSFFTIRIHHFKMTESQPKGAYTIIPNQNNTF